MGTKENLDGTTNSSFSMGKIGSEVTIHTGIENPKDDLGTVGDLYIHADKESPGIWQKHPSGWMKLA